MFLKFLLAASFFILVIPDKIDGYRMNGPIPSSNNVFGPRDIFEDYNSLDVIDKGDTVREVVVYENGNDGYATAMLQQLSSTFNQRIDTMNERLTNVEKSTQEIKDRLTKLDCYDMKVDDPLAPSGVYQFFLDYKGKRPVSAYCDMVTEGGGWTVLQRRRPRQINGTERETEFHRRNLHDYTLGFGSPSADYWLGLENIYILTHTRNYEMRIELQDFQDLKAHANYDRFYIEEERTGYRIHISGYGGDAGDSLSGDEGVDNFTADGMLFTTHDKDRDTSHEINCASHWDIGGWWFNRCSWANLNGPYKFQNGDEKCIGINWHKWRNLQCLKGTKIMIRPVKNY